jgi:hypothetical protein
LANRTVHETARYAIVAGRADLGAVAADSLKPGTRTGVLVDRLMAVLPSDIYRMMPALPWGPVSGTGGCGSVDHLQALHAALGESLYTAAELARGRGTGALAGDEDTEQAIRAAAVRGFASMAEDLTRRGRTLMHIGSALAGEAWHKDPRPG